MNGKNYIDAINEKMKNQIEYMKMVIMIVKNGINDGSILSTEKKRLRLHQYLIENMSIKEIAKLSNKPESTIKAHLYKLIMYGNRNIEWHKCYPVDTRKFNPKEMDEIKTKALEELKGSEL